MKRLLLLVGVLVFGMMLTAGATTNCQTFRNHSGHVPGSYDYAEFYEDGVLVLTGYTEGQDIYANPALAGEGNRSWDQVKKCHGTTTTTSIPEETTTLPEETTTTVAETTSTTAPTTTTVPDETSSTGLLVSDWSASSECLTVTAVWGEGIAGVDVWQRTSEADTQVARLLVSGETFTTSDTESEWILIPITTTGYAAVPDQISLFTEECTPEAPVTTVAPEAPELPLTGPAVFVGLLLAGSALLGVGVSTVRASKRIR